MAPIDFIPRHNQPFTLEQAMLLEIDILVAEINRLNNSISHLERTQEELISYIRDDPNGDEGGEIAQAKDENDQVISSQRERITLIKVALLNKIGEGGMKHYGLDPKTKQPQASTTIPTTRTNVPQDPSHNFQGSGTTAGDGTGQARVDSSSTTANEAPASESDSGMYL